MSETAKIILCGQPREKLLEQIASIKAWDNGHNYPIEVSADGQRFIMDDIIVVEDAINNDLVKYIEENLSRKNMVLKTGGDDDLYLVPDPDKFDTENKFHKIRHKPTNFTPKKKKRK